MSDNQRAQTAEALLDAFSQQVPLRPERLPTFMEITGYPHYENVCSNILAFFFNPDNPHGLGTLFLDALAQVGDIKDQAGTLGRNVQVGREDPTDAGRIDILIQSDSHAVLIENKIFWGGDNPLDDYAKYLDSLPQCHKYRFLLTLKPIEESIKRDIECYGFQNITHEDLANEIRGLLGGYVANVDTRYLTFMLDFLNTLDYLPEDMAMDQKFVDFLKNRPEGEVEKFYNQINEFKKGLREQIDLLEKRIDVSPYDNVSPWKNPENLSHVLTYDITLSSFENKVVVETVINCKGWKVQIWLRRGAGGGPVTNPGRREELLELLRRLGIPLEEEKGERFLRASFEDAVNSDLPDQIDWVVQDVVNKLACSDGTS